MSKQNTFDDAKQTAYKAGNFCLTAFVTSAAIVAFQGPMRFFTLNKMKTGNFIPPELSSAPCLAIVNSAYRGTTASMTGSTARAAYVTNSKKMVGSNEAVAEGASEELVEHNVANQKKNFAGQLTTVMGLSAGEILLTQVPETLSQLKKLATLPESFKWNSSLHNFKKLAVTGAGARYASCFINFSALCLVEDAFAKRLPIEHKPMKHFCAGVLSGMTAATFSMPVSYYRDYALTRVTYTDGMLNTVSSLQIYKDFSGYLRQQGWKKVLKAAGQEFLKQAPVRLATTAGIFGIVSVMNEILGSDPIEKIATQAEPWITRGRNFFFSEKTPPVDPHKTPLEEPKTKAPEGRMA